MKVLLITLLLVGTAFSAVVQQQQTMGEGPACPIADPLEFEAGNINITLLPVLEIDVGSTQGGGVALGLSTLKYSYTLNLILLTINFNAQVSASVSGGAYAATGVIDATPFSNAVIPSGIFAGAGAYEGAIVGGNAEGSASIFVNLITSKITISRLVLSVVTFDSLSVNLEGFTSNGAVVDFAAWSASIKENFDAEFVTVGADFVEKVRTEVINPLLKEYTLEDFLDLIGENTTPGPCDAY